MFTPRPAKISHASSYASSSHSNNASGTVSGSGSALNEISPLLAAELGLEYSSLRAIGNCPTGMYVTPSAESLLKWYGVFFVHRGPYAGSVLRFTLSFPPSYPQSAPVIRFDSDVFHPMVDPKTKIWSPRGRLIQWQPRIDHVPHLLHSLKASFKTQALQSITEDQAINKQVWSLYHHSRQTFLSMTSQRALHSTSLHHLYPSAHPILSPTSPTKNLLTVPPPMSPTKSTYRGTNAQPSTQSQTTTSLAPMTPSRQRTISGGSMSIKATSPHHDGHRRTTSIMSAVSNIDEGPIVFKEISEEDKARLWAGLRRSLGEEETI
ncbi:ubiquitin-conjugating enzyme/RWD-like protein [Kockovaella imperatae]|uniref:Ubiquitin-conjugating enzyme/RWD-like protein n=1 Tax=Kockovaella imperatae TaxID=4999 RepID=A0A1Y1UEY2_9TREE|nr:ubiquitin-conjugating enzyme/RWD-like protein [Kockovaella imperatae]ORX36620.1 ubiquitin-conjugating enzyme/RWD-like protein [Kockovaella imperatae]